MGEEEEVSEHPLSVEEKRALGREVRKALGEEEPTTTFNPGDVVRLKSGGPKMVVSATYTDKKGNNYPTPSAVVTWAAEGQLRDARVPVVVLEHADAVTLLDGGKTRAAAKSMSTLDSEIEVGRHAVRHAFTLTQSAYRISAIMMAPDTWKAVCEHLQSQRPLAKVEQELFGLPVVLDEDIPYGEVKVA